MCHFWISLRQCHTQEEVFQTPQEEDRDWQFRKRPWLPASTFLGGSNKTHHVIAPQMILLQLIQAPALREPQVYALHCTGKEAEAWQSWFTPYKSRVTHGWYQLGRIIENPGAVPVGQPPLSGDFLVGRCRLGLHCTDGKHWGRWTPFWKLQWRQVFRKAQAEHRLALRRVS